MLRNAATTLFGEIHEIEMMTVTAFLRIVVFQSLPLSVSQMPSSGAEFFRRAYGPQCMGNQFPAGLHLANNFVGPGVGDMTVRANRSYA